MVLPCLRETGSNILPNIYRVNARRIIFLVKKDSWAPHDDGVLHELKGYGAARSVNGSLRIIDNSLSCVDGMLHEVDAGCE